MANRKKLFRVYFLTGLLVIVPVIVTFWVVESVIRWMDSILNVQSWSPIFVPGLGLIIGIGIVLLAGFLGHNVIGSWVIGSFSKFVNHLPIVGGIYTSVRQVFLTIIQGTGQKFGRAVLVEFPRKGIWTIGFVTSEDLPSYVEGQLDGFHIGVYVPTTPNPTGGYFLYFPKQEVKPLDMTVDEALKAVVSLGLAKKHER